MAEADTRETPEQVADAKAKIEPLSARLLRVMNKVKVPLEPEEGSPLARLDEMTTPFKTSELVISNLNVGIDNLFTFFRYFKKTNELPMLAHYGLIRSAIEATSYGLWVLAGKQQAAASRTLRIARVDQENARKLFKALGDSMWDTDEMQGRARERHDALSGIDSSDVDKSVQATNIILAVEQHFEQRAALTGLHVWRSTSGLTHGSPAAMVALLERAPDGTRTSRMVWSVESLETAIENIEALLTRIEDLRIARPRPRGGTARVPSQR
ncbi:MAG: hypothetical protein KF772_04395 [Cryobacterium sp.]|nr:hypothetical protein [Cryobacterium sp.]